MLRIHKILCPVDFSQHSRSALRHAAVVASHFGARLTAVTVSDPLLAEVAEFSAASGSTDTIARELRQFVHHTLENRPTPLPDRGR